MRATTTAADTPPRAQPPRCVPIPRVLIEHRDSSLRLSRARHLSEAGLEVATCGGPQVLARRGCPLLETGNCSLAAAADVIYTALRWRDRRCLVVLHELRSRYPDTALIVETDIADAHLVEDQVTACTVLTAPVGTARMLTAIDAALRQR